MNDFDTQIIAGIKHAQSIGANFTVSVDSMYQHSPEADWEWANRIARETEVDVAHNSKARTIVFLAPMLTPERSASPHFRRGFEAAKKAAIRCAEGSEYWGNCVRGCKAVRHSIEHMQLLDADRFNEDGSLKPEPTVEYDRQKHGPIVNGRVQLPIPALALAAGATHEMTHACGDCLVEKGRIFCTMNCGPRIIR